MDDAARAQVDEQLRRLADGDRSAFEPAYALLWPVVRAFCQRLVPSEDVEDAAQLALVKVFERAATYDVRKPALSWVLAIAAWECRTLRRRRGRRNEHGDDAIAAVADDAASPEMRAIERDLAAAVADVLAGLPETDRATLTRAIADELPPDVSNTTFRKRRERALARLKAAWRRAYGG